MPKRSVDSERAYRRLLGWYPREWRRLHGEVWLGSALDEADRLGRTRPNGKERLAAVSHGLGMRLNGGSALRCIMLALAVAVPTLALTIWGAPLGGGGSVAVLLSSGVAPALASLGAVGLWREHGHCPPPRALAIAGLAVVGCAMLSCAVLAWSIGFDAADDGLPQPPFADGLLWFVAAAWALGAAALALGISGLIRRGGMRPAAAGAIALLAGTLLAPVLGATIAVPGSSIGAYVGLGVVGVMLERRSVRAANAVERPSVPEDAPLHVPQARPFETSSAVLLRTPRALALFAALLGLGGASFALTGSQWPGAAMDGTEAMRRGMALSLLTAPILMAALGLLLDRRGTVRGMRLWGPLMLFALAVTVVAADYLLRSAEDSADALGVVLGAVLAGAAVAWWVDVRLGGTPRSRLLLGALITLGAAAAGGALILLLLAFALPLLAVAVAIWAPRLAGGRTPIALAGGLVDA